MELPIILAGPILRKVDEQSITIWIATSESLKVHGSLYTLNESIEVVPSKNQTESLQIGKNLFIHLVTLFPVSNDFPVDTLLGYNLHFKQGSSFDLGTLGLLDSNHADAIVYGNLPYPSFFINRQSDSRILYGSCRKLHGKGEDALAAGDSELQITYSDLTKRPNSLFLIGDQIYADDVADPLFPIINSLAKNLIGADENLSLIDKRLSMAPFSASLSQINGRQFIMEHFCKFTSRHSRNHVMKFGEYAALYLLSWGPEIWKSIQANGGISTFDEELEKRNIHFVFPPISRNEKEHKKEQLLYRKRYEEQAEDLRQCISSLHKIRRLYANIPVYMIFDDHDITDDWNLSSEWRDNVGNSPLGKHVIANGLGAYFAFQAWGNSPESFDSNLLINLQVYFRDLKIGSGAYEYWTNNLLNHKKWQFVAPTNPKALFLDTRTMRAYDHSPEPARLGMAIRETLKSPQLVSSEGWQYVQQTLEKSGWKRGERLIIVSPAPLYGIGLIESFLQSSVPPLKALGMPVYQAIDFEAWKYNGKGFSEFLERVLRWKPSACIILSGDVHYASSVKTSVQFRNGRNAQIYQFTSSPLNNMSFSGIWGKLLKTTALANGYKRKRKYIARYCDHTFRIIEGTPAPKNPEYRWKEEIRYLTTNQWSILQTSNNLGLFTISQGIIQNHLLQMKAFEKYKISFHSIELHEKHSLKNIKKRER